MVYPVEGYYIAGVAHVAHECDGEPPPHDLCLPSGAFTTDEPPPTEDPPKGGSSADKE